MYLCIRKPQFVFVISLSIVVSLGQECTHVMPKSYQGLVEKSSRRVALGVLSEKPTLYWYLCTQ